MIGRIVTGPYVSLDAAAGCRVIVAGATGNQGGAVTRELCRRGHHVIAITRSVDSTGAQRLRDFGATTVASDLNDTARLAALAKRADAMFAITRGNPREPGLEMEQGIAQIDAARAAGLRHLILASAASAHEATGVPTMDAKVELERRCERTSQPTTIIAPTFFMDNVLNPPYREHIELGHWLVDVPPTKPLQLISCRNIATVVRTAIENPGSFIGERIELASDELTGPQMAALIGATLDRPIEFRRPTTGSGAPRERASLFDWIGRSGFSVDRRALRSRLPEVAWDTFRSWCADYLVRSRDEIGSHSGHRAPAR